MKRTNKGVQPENNGQPPAEFVEKRPSAKGNSEQTTVTCTQGQEAALIGLDRVREAAKRDSFTLTRINVSAFDLRQESSAVVPHAWDLCGRCRATGIPTAT